MRTDRDAGVRRSGPPHREERGEHQTERTKGETGPPCGARPPDVAEFPREDVSQGRGQEEHSGGPPTKCPKQSTRKGCKARRALLQSNTGAAHGQGAPRGPAVGSRGAEPAEPSRNGLQGSQGGGPRSASTANTADARARVRGRTPSATRGRLRAGTRAALGQQAGGGGRGGGGRGPRRGPRQVAGQGRQVRACTED